MHPIEARFALVLAVVLAAGCARNSGAPSAPAAPAYTIARLTRSEAAESNPAFAPDGRRIAFARDGAIWVLDLARHSESQVAPVGDHPSWSADGHALYFVRRDVGGGVIHRLAWLDPATGETGLASPDTVDVYEPAASPAGGALAYRALSRVSTRQSLRVVDLSGTPPLTIGSPGPWIDRSPAWSPDGTQLAFVRLLDSGSAILRAGPAGRPDDIVSLGARTEGAADPAFSADGRRIIFSRDGTLVGMPVTGGAVTRLLEGRGFALGPAVCSDGRRLVFACDRAGGFDLWMLTDPTGLGPGPYTF